MSFADWYDLTAKLRSLTGDENVCVEIVGKPAGLEITVAWRTLKGATVRVLVYANSIDELRRLADQTWAKAAIFEKIVRVVEHQCEV